MLSKRAQDFCVFSARVVQHIDGYTVPQYGDKGEDQCTDYTSADHVKQANKYLARFGKNSRPGQELLDLYKAAHYIQMATMQLEIEMKVG